MYFAQLRLIDRYGGKLGRRVEGKGFYFLSKLMVSMCEMAILIEGAIAFIDIMSAQRSLITI